MSEARKKISVMQVIYSLRIGGSEKLAMDISLSVNPDRFCPSVCALDMGGDLARELEIGKVDHFVLHRKGHEPDVLRRLYRLFRNNQIDVIHTHHFTQLYYAALPARLAGVRIIHTEHEYFSYMESPFARFMIKPLSHFCDRMTVVGSEVADYFVRSIGISEERVMVVPNGVDIAKFNYDGSLVRKELGLSPQDIVIGTVGRLDVEKDQKTLLEAFQKLSCPGSHIVLVIVGQGPMEEELKSFAKRLGVSERTVFLGYRRDIPKLLSAMDIFVLSSIREGLPISLIEAMAARKAVVASDVGSIKNLVQDGQNGFLVPSGDANAFGNILRRLIETAELRKSIAEAGRRTVEASFNLSETIRTYEELYHVALRRPHVWN